MLLHDTGKLRASLPLGLSLSLATACSLPTEQPQGPMPASSAVDARGRSEHELRLAHGIPDEAEYVLVLGQFAHQDWDWNVGFREYLNQGGGGHSSVTEVYRQAFELLRSEAGQAQGYTYSSEVTGFLAAYLAENPSELDGFREEIGDRLRLLGGGTTSPDNLLPHGESLLRNYLVGSLWAEEALGLELSQTFWIPDDFGHDAQVPVIIEALGFRSASFARIPGGSGGSGGLNDGTPPIPGSPAAQLTADKADLLWLAKDGSQTLGHWMNQGYCQANDLSSMSFESESAARQGVQKSLLDYLTQNQPRAATGYVFVPVGCDFSTPVNVPYIGSSGQDFANLKDIADWWNQDVYRGAQGQGVPARTFAIEVGFDSYADLVLATDWAKTAEPRPFHPTPYWTGFYASRPGLKILHQEATRSLLAAETLGVLADSVHTDPEAWSAAVQAREAMLRVGWNQLTPSTHHDYVTGTAADSVYLQEQVGLLGNAKRTGKSLEALALQQLASSVTLKDFQDGSLTPVVVANPLGWERSQVTLVPDLHLGGSAVGTQDTPEGTLVLATAPGLGYRRNDIGGSAAPGGVDAVTVKHGSLSGPIVMENEALVLTLSIEKTVASPADWVISSLVDKATQTELIPSGKGANAIQIYQDDGGLYNFGNENYNGDRFATPFALQSVTWTVEAAQILETGPLRATVRTIIRSDQREIIRDYTLTAHSPLVTIRATGSADSVRSVGVGFPLHAAAQTLEHGTAYHWDDATPEAGWTQPVTWEQPVFQATHAFVLPKVSGHQPYALYHQSLQAVSNHTEKQQVLAVLWRNTPSDDHRGQTGEDTGTHTHTYALRVPSGLMGPASGQPLMESMELFTPLTATVVSSSSNDRLPAERSLAKLSGPALITAAKAGSRDTSSLILRLYKPDNATPGKVTLQVDPSALGLGSGVHDLTAQALTALEQADPEGPPVSVEGGKLQTTLQTTLHRALLTLGVSPSR